MAGKNKETIFLRKNYVLKNLLKSLTDGLNDAEMCIIDKQFSL